MKEKMYYMELTTYILRNLTIAVTVTLNDIRKPLGGYRINHKVMKVIQ